jgi:Zn-dependent M28 family amino/carboxypeptidase
MEIYKIRLYSWQQLVPMVLSYSKTLKANPNLKFYFKQSCQQLEDVLSYNVVGDWTEHPENNIIVVGGHLDSWDLADGSQDDGAGVVQSMEVAIF